MQPGKIVAIIQARMASSRLPGKVLLDIGGQPMLARVVDRARLARTVDRVVVATTTDASDDPVEALCQERRWAYYRGSQHDVLDRYYQAARISGAQVIARITADCPIIDPGLIDDTVNAFLGESGTGDQGPEIRDLQPDEADFSESGEPAAIKPRPWPPVAGPYDFAANRLPPPWGRTYPIGLDVEVCSFQALERAWNEADQPYQREHVMPYLYENEPVLDSRTMQVIAAGSAAGSDKDYPHRRGFRVLLLNHDPDYGALRWTVDTPEDLELIRQIYARFDGRDDFSWLEVLSLFENEPDLAQINAGVQHKTFQDVDDRQGQ